MFCLLSLNLLQTNYDFANTRAKLTLYETKYIRLPGELHTSAQLFSCFLFPFFLRKLERHKRRRLVPETVVLCCNWWKPVARLMSVLEGFLLPLFCAPIGRV